METRTTSSMTRQGTAFICSMAWAPSTSSSKKTPDTYERIASLATPPGSRTGLFVPDWGKLFVAVLQQGTKNAEVRVYQAN
jgi:hypothetical protein